MRPVLPILLTVTAMTGVAAADDGYCDYVQGTAAADSAVLVAPEVFAQLGYIELNSVSGAGAPALETDGTRFVGGVRWRLSGIYEGSLTKRRARADCARHQASEQIRGDIVRAGLAARAKVLADAMPEAEKVLASTNADFAARRATAQEATATRLRIEDLRRLAFETQAALRALPTAAGGDLTGSLTAFQRADAELEASDAKLRRARAIDVSVRFGVDEYLSIDTGDRSPLFGVVSVGVNLGVLFQGSGNARAAAGRQRLAASTISSDGTSALAEAATRRAEETATLEADLKRQLDALERVGGEDSRRYRLVVWFDWIKVRAEHAYYEAHAAALRQVLGGATP